MWKTASTQSHSYCTLDSIPNNCYYQHMKSPKIFFKLLGFPPFPPFISLLSLLTRSNSARHLLHLLRIRERNEPENFDLEDNWTYTDATMFYRKHRDRGYRREYISNAMLTDNRFDLTSFFFFFFFDVFTLMLLFIHIYVYMLF